MRKGLGQSIDLTDWHAKCSTDITDRMPHLVGVHHGDHRAPLGAKARHDRVVHLQTPGRLDINVYVWQASAQRRQEALHQQAMADWVNTGNTEQVVDQTARPRATCSTTNAQLPDQTGDL